MSKPVENFTMQLDSKIFIAGHRGLVGSAIVRHLEKEGYKNLITRTHSELDLTDAAATASFFEKERPEFVFFAAAKVGGILANNTYPVDFLSTNMKMELNVVESCHRFGVKKLLYLGSSCIYPKMAAQPIQESSLLTGSLEPTNEWYAIAKIAGIKMCQAYRRQYGMNSICLMPTNMYGPKDNYDLQNSHVLPALLRKAHEAKERGDPTLLVWGTGTVKREFLHADDLARASVYLMNHYNDEGIVNVGTGIDVTIKELAELVCKAVGFEGKLTFDASKPDGTPRKLLDVSKLKAAGWSATISLEEGLKLTYAQFLKELADGSIKK